MSESKLAVSTVGRESLCLAFSSVIEEPQAGTLEDFLELPSGGDTSYAGLVCHEDKLWISYYSGHEGPGTSIYLAKVRFP